MPENTFCFDISTLNAQILEAKGFNAETVDCLNLKINTDVVVMNPPYSQGRWKRHTEHMLTCLNKGGRLVAILPSTAVDKITANDDIVIEWSEILKRPFQGLFLSVCFRCLHSSNNLTANHSQLHPGLKIKPMI